MTQEFTMLAKIMELEAENLALRSERERLKDMVAVCVDRIAIMDTGEGGKNRSMIETEMFWGSDPG